MGSPIPRKLFLQGNKRQPVAVTNASGMSLDELAGRRGSQKNKGGLGLGLEFRVQGFGFRVWGSGFRVSGFGFGV